MKGIDSAMIDKTLSDIDQDEELEMLYIWQRKDWQKSNQMIKIYLEQSYTSTYPIRDLLMIL